MHSSQYTKERVCRSFHYVFVELVMPNCSHQIYYSYSTNNHFVFYVQLICSLEQLLLVCYVSYLSKISSMLLSHMQALRLKLLVLFLQFNCSTPLKTMLFCWGPYGVLAFYAAVANATVISPKLRMVRKSLCFNACFNQQIPSKQFCF